MLGTTSEEAVAVGDTRFDVNMLRKAGLGVALKGDEALEEVTDVVIEELVELLRAVRLWECR